VLLAAARLKRARMADQRIVIAGLGQAGTGTAEAIRAALLEEGLSDEEARRRIFAIDVNGLLLDDDPALEEPQRPWAQPRAAVAGWRLDDPNRIQLADVVRNAKATVLIGYTAQPGLFSREILEQLAANDPRPVVLPLSNPTQKSECTPEQAAAATGGRALVATGSPFPPLVVGGREQVVSQCNNLYMFPGIGLGALIAGAARITDRMFVQASKALAAMITRDELERGQLLPPMSTIRDAAFTVARAVAIEAREAGLGRLLPDEELEALLRRAQWWPRVYPYRPGTPER
jgi:malate dehydrogenase (oxaloacetate-decarboxylating)